MVTGVGEADMVGEDGKRISSLESEVNILRSDIKHVANSVMSNSKKLDILLEHSSALNSKSDTTIQSITFMREDHDELKKDFKQFRRLEYDKFKTDVTDRISKTNVSMSRLIGVAAGASTVIYGVIETLKSFIRGG